MKWLDYKLEAIVFISGAVVMILEMLGSRILAPYLGTTIVIWTSLIGIILGCLSIGYWYGGELADKNPNYKTFAKILFAAAIAIALIVFLKAMVLGLVTAYIFDIRIGAVIATTLLFAPASILLGMVSPYAVRLKLKTMGTSGATVGKLYSISTLGSIVGTFLAGFVLIVQFDNITILFLLALIMTSISLLAYHDQPGLKVAAAIVFFLYLTNTFPTPNFEGASLSFNTQYNSVQVIEHSDVNTGKQIREMIVNKAHASAMFVDDDELVYDYSKLYGLANHFKPDLDTALLIGGAGYTYPTYFLRKNLQATMDVVEIDPQLTKIATQYFNLDPNDPRLSIFHEDARIYLNKSQKKYDVFFGDAFNYIAPPFHLTTKEAMAHIYRILEDDGVALFNVISAMDAPFIKAEYKTLKLYFPQVYIFPLKGERPNYPQNIMVVALKSHNPAPLTSSDPELDDMLKKRWTHDIANDAPILTDEYAPTDYYATELLKRYY